MELFRRYHNIANQTVYTLPTGEKVYPAVVDVKKGMQGGGDISYVKTDSNVGFIVVSFVEGESKFRIPSTATVTCNIHRPDGHFIEIECTKMDESTVQIALGTAGTKVEGVHSFDIKIHYSEDVVIGTPIMNYMVQNGLTLDGAIEEDERLPMLTSLIEEVKAIHENTNELAEEVSELSENVGAIVEGANVRLDEVIAEFRSQSEELIDNANSAVVEVNNSLEQITTSLEEVNQGIDEVNNALEEVSSNMDRIDSVMVEASQVIESMEELQATTIGINEQSESLIAEMQGLVADGLDIKEIADARDGEESLSARLARDLQDVYEYVDNKQVDLSPVESKIAENTNKLNTHERLIDNNLNSIGSLATRITNNTKEINNTKQEITTKVNALKTEVGEDIASINDDVARIQEELQKSENTKYSTENGVKEFSCKDGYVDNVYIEGETLVNLYTNTSNNYVSTSDVGGSPVVYGVNNINLSLLKADTTYTCIIHDSSGKVTSSAICTMMGDYGFYFPGDSNKEVTVFKTPNEIDSTKIISIFAYGEYVADDVSKVTFTLLEGDHTDKPISYFKGLASVGQEDKIEVVSYSKNLDERLDLSNLTWKDGYYVHIGTGAEIVSKSHCYTTNYIPIQKTGCNMVFINANPHIVFYDENKNVIYQELGYFPSDDFVIVDVPINAKFLRFTGQISEKNNVSVYYSQCDKKQISTTLRSLPNGVRDTIEKRGNKYVKVQRCGEYVVNNTLGYRNGTLKANTLDHCIVISDMKNVGGRQDTPQNETYYLQVDTFKQINNKYVSDKGGDWVNIDEEYILQEGDYLIISIATSKVASASGFGNWVKNNPITVVYELAKPIEVELPNFNPQTFEGDTTLVLNSGVVQGECSFEVTNSMSSELEVLKDKVSSLDEEQESKILALHEENKLLREELTQIQTSITSLMALTLEEK